MGYFNDVTIKKFWSNVKRGAPGECWEWKGNKDVKGYGRLRSSHEGRSKTYKAHRVALFIATGLMGEDRMGLHNCDNPGCCNPEHLRWGNALDNWHDHKLKSLPEHDKRRKGLLEGRKYVHLAHAATRKLTDGQVLRMRELRKLGLSIRELGKLFDVDGNTAHDVVRGVSYRHVPEGQSASTGSSVQ